MTRAVASAHQVALAAGRLISRDFVWFVVRDWETSAPVTDGYWSDVGSLDAQVIDPDTGTAVTRSYAGGAGLISISDIALTSNLTVQTATIKLAQCSDRINDLLRAYDCKQARVEVHRGQFDLETREMVAPAEPRFIGFIDDAPVRTPKENENGDVSLRVTSHTQELTRTNPDTRSDASQRARNATDNFYQDVGVVGDWQHFWGRASGTVTTSTLGADKQATFT